MRKKEQNLPWSVLAIIFLGSLLVYWLTLARGIFWWDSGELIANVATLGIAHRPSFPIYILLAKVFSFFLLGSLTSKVNFFSAILASLSLVTLFLIFVQLRRSFLSSLKISDNLFYFVSGISIILAGFTYSFWIQAVRAEVYTLGIFTFLLLLYLALRLSEGGRKQGSLQQTKIFSLFCFILGLGFGNHYAILISTLPALIYLILQSNFRKFLTTKILFIGLALFVLGISIYLYLPIRSSAGPAFNWGNPSTFGQFLKSILALESLQKMELSSGDPFWSKLFGTVNLITDQLGLLALLICLVGLFHFYLNNKKWFWFIVWLILGNCFITALLSDEFIFDNPDLHAYLIPSMIALSIGFGLGVLVILSNLKSVFYAKRKALRFQKLFYPLAILIIIIISLLPAYNSYPKANLSKNNFPVAYAKGIITDLPQNSLVIIDNPNLDFILRGLQYGDKVRSDLVILNRSFMPAYWYCQQERKKHPEIFQGIPEAKTGEPLYVNVAKKALRDKRPVYIEYTEKDTVIKDFLMPSGYLMQLSVRKQSYLSKQILSKQTLWEKENFNWEDNPLFYRDGDAQRMWVLSWFRMGYFYEARGVKKLALEKYNKILAVYPQEPELLARVQRLTEGNLRASK
ncbi:MAG: hypothetical protein A2145_01165 [candidate division Zixibacteria bacterium RBG_16_40_9]|nr:MAG: hypothetical protein A2145_01165 [candidate division Zixibacteria bacterium RBG_16_40_9]